MSENKPGDNQNQHFGRDAKSGLTIPRKDTGGRSTETRSRRDPGIYEKLRRSGQVDESVVTRWFIPAVALVLILFVVGVAMYFSQGSELNALKREVAALGQQSIDTDTLSSDMDQVLARVDELGARLSSAEGMNAEIQALREDVTRQNETIEALTSRIDELEEVPRTSDSADSSSRDTEASGSRSTTTDQTGSGDWVINLITVADRAAAERFQERLDNLDVDSRIESITRDGKTLQRVVVPGFGSRDEARNAASGLKNQLELSDDPWIARQ